MVGNVSISRNAKMLRVLLPRDLWLSAKILRIFSPPPYPAKYQHCRGATQKCNDPARVQALKPVRTLW